MKLKPRNGWVAAGVEFNEVSRLLSRKGPVTGLGSLKHRAANRINGIGFPADTKAPAMPFSQACNLLSLNYLSLQA